MNRIVLIVTALIATTNVGGFSGAIPFDGCGDRNGGQIKGIARDEAGKSVSGQVLELDRYACNTVTASDGTFLFLSVSPGEHTIRASGWNYRKGPVVRVTVAAGAVSNTNFRLSPANDVLDCIEAPGCAQFLKPNSADIAALDNAERMREASIRTAYALTHAFEGSLAAIGYYGGRIKVINANTFESDPSYYMNVRTTSELFLRCA